MMNDMVTFQKDFVRPTLLNDLAQIKLDCELLRNFYLGRLISRAVTPVNRDGARKISCDCVGVDRFGRSSRLLAKLAKILRMPQRNREVARTNSEEAR